jgi:vacuolar-type H+-ATPase subunit I/STV1
LLPFRILAADSVESVEKAATEWVKTRTETARLKSEWASQQDLLQSTVNALNERAQTLEEKRDALKAKTAKDRDEIDAARNKNQTAATEIRAAADHMNELRDRLIQLRPSLPPRLSEALELAYRSLASTDLGPSERMQATMTVLNRCVQFNRTITNSDDVLTIEGESGAKSYETIYWGLSHGYALDRAAGKVWLGSPGPKGWSWEPHPEAFRQVVDLLAVFKDKAEPGFTPVPAKLAHASSASTNP